MTIDVVMMKAVNEQNAQRAEQVRAILNEHKILGLNMMSSPGSGKTSLLEATFARMGDSLRFAIIEGDVFTTLDAERIAKYGVDVIQVNTEGSCHMTAHMVLEVLPRLKLDGIDVLVVENIGNLICPASFDLGEHYRVACLSTPEGIDKIDKYPKLFTVANLNLITKADLAPHVNFDIATATINLGKLNPDAPVIATSATQDVGLDMWCDWIRDNVKRIAAS